MARIKARWCEIAASRINEVLSAKLATFVEGNFDRVTVGQKVEIARLPHSQRTLYVRPLA